ncbi:MAG: peptidoglycan DD-metalloendopeptidase family protein [Nitriliruptoraceae bacterium]
MSALAPLVPTSRWVRRAMVLGAALLAVTETAGVVGGGGWWHPATAQTLDDLDDAEEVVDELADAQAAAIDRYEATWAEIERTRMELAELERSTEALAAEVAATTQALEQRARLAFMRGPMESFEVLFQAEAAQLAVERVGLLSALQRRDRIEVEQAAAGQVALEQSRELIRVQEAELLALQEVLEADAAVLQDELERANEEADAIRSLVARQRRIDRGAQQGIYACIFDRGATRFRDTWGAPRSGGRRHKGTDLFAPYRAPVYAITSGVVHRHSNSGLGGIGLYLRGDDGNLYYYAHLDSIDAGATVGTRVTAGELVGRNGYTGNASRSAPHVHFELHPGGGAAINPYPWLAAACF